MRILLTATAATDQRLDGITVFTRSLAEHLTARGQHACALFVPDLHHHGKATLDDLTIDGQRVFRAALPEPHTPDEALDLPGCTDLFRKAVAEFRTDVIHFNAIELLSAGMVEAAAEQGIPTVLTLHDFYLVCPAARLLELGGRPCPGPERGKRCGACLAATGHLTGRYRGPWRWLARRWDVKVRRRYAGAFRRRFERLKTVVGRVGAVVCPSQYLGDRIVGEGMLAACELIPNGSDIEALPAREGGGPPALGMLAHHSQAKGTELLVEALRLVPGLAVRVSVHGTGDAKYLRDVRRLARDDGRISFEGPFAPSDVPGILAGLDAVVVPSVFPETYSLVAHDAVAAGRPCIVPSDSGATESIADERHGFHFTRGSGASLAEALKKLVEDPQTPGRLRDNILADRPVITRAAAVEQHLALYGRLLAGGKENT